MNVLVPALPRISAVTRREPEGTHGAFCTLAAPGHITTGPQLMDNVHRCNKHKWVFAFPPSVVCHLALVMNTSVIIPARIHLKREIPFSRLNENVVFSCSTSTVVDIIYIPSALVPLDGVTSTVK